MINFEDTPEWKEMEARVDRQVAEEGGSLGSNMAEPLYFDPKMLTDESKLPPEEQERRKKEREEILEFIRS